MKVMLTKSASWPWWMDYNSSLVIQLFNSMIPPDCNARRSHIWPAVGAWLDAGLVAGLADCARNIRFLDAVPLKSDTSHAFWVCSPRSAFTLAGLVLTSRKWLLADRVFGLSVGVMLRVWPMIDGLPCRCELKAEWQDVGRRCNQTRH